MVATKPMKRARQANGQPVMKEPSEAPSSKLILLVDDIIASGTTLRQAIKYLEKRLPHWKVYFLPLFSRNEKYLDLIRDHIVWSAPVFRPALPDAEIAGIAQLNARTSIPLARALTPFIHRIVGRIDL